MTEEKKAARDGGTDRSRRELLRYTGAGFLSSALLGTRGVSARSDYRPTTSRQSRNFELGEGPPVAVERVASGLTSPVQFAAPGNDRQYIADQTGQIYVFGRDGLLDESFLDVSNRMVNLGENLPDRVTYDERGLLGLAFHPNFPSDPRFYVRYSAPFVTTVEDSHTEVLAEYTARDGTTADPYSERVLIAFPQLSPIHQGGTITFGPDGYLYIAMGDGDWGESAQSLEYNLLGSILRIDVDGGGNGDPYGIPRDNPLVDKPGRPEYFAWGFRNPWRISFYDGILFAADVGLSTYEEINIVTKGQNYGWPIKEGTHCLKSPSTENCREKSDIDVPSVGRSTSLVDPATQFPHAAGNEIIGRAAVGGYVYDKKEIPDLQGKYVFGNYTHRYEEPGSYIFASPILSDDDLWPIEKLQIVNAPNREFNRNVISFGRDATGDIYVLTTRTPLAEDTFAGDDGEVFRLVEPGSGSPL